MSVDEVGRQLSIIRERLGDLVRQSQAVTAALENGRDALARLFIGSSHPRVAQAHGQLSLAGQRLREAAQEIAEAAQAVSVYSAALTGGSGAAGLSDAGTAGQRTVPGRRTVRPRNPLDYEGQGQWARSAYDNIRARPDGDVIAGHLRDVPRIDGSVGFTPQEVDRIREHIFVEVHPLTDFDGTIVYRRYDADEDMAEAWLRLRHGRHRPEDIILLEHEVTEAQFYDDHPGATYAEAHAAANLIANWQDRIPAPTGEDFEAPWR